MPSTSMSPTTLPPRRSPILGSWLPVTQIHSRSSCMICRISSSSRPMRSGRLDVVQAVAERDDGAGARSGRWRSARRGQRLARVVGRHELPALGERRALLEVQVGDDQRVFARPVERAGHVGAEQLAADARWSGPGSRRRRGAPVSARACRSPLRRLADQRSVGGLAQQCPRARNPPTASLPISSRIGTESGETRSRG